MGSKREWVIVPRSGQGANMTDRTAVIVWTHEVPILAEVHGTEPIIIDDYELLLDKDVKVRTERDGTKTPREGILAQMIRDLGLGEKFTSDPSEEYDRLVAVYGMHPKVEMPFVQFIYGRFEEGRFTKAVGVEALEDMSLVDLRARCDELEIPYEPKDKRQGLIAAIRAATTETATARELRGRHEQRVA